MHHLILTELKKVFRRKYVFIIWGLMIGFCFLNNILYWLDYDEEGYAQYEEQENLEEQQKIQEQELAKFHKDRETDLPMYVVIKTKIDLLAVKKQFPQRSWQYRKAEDYLYDILYQKNVYTYQEPNEERLKEVTEQYQFLSEKLKKNNWKYFLQKEQENLTQEIKTIESQITELSDQREILELETLLKEKEEARKVLKYRENHQIIDDGGYLNQALLEYVDSKKQLSLYEKKKQTPEEQLQYQQLLKKKALSQYILEKKKNIQKQNTLNYQLRTIVEDYELFMVILVLMVTATLICDEFHKGTIKLLLIKPYSRSKILLSKYFTSLVVLGISIALLIVVQLIFGSLLFGVDSLKVPVMEYNYINDTLVGYPVFYYMGIRIIARIPFFLIITMLCLGVGVIVANTAVSMMIPFILYLFAPTFLELAVNHHLKFMNYFLPLNWNFQDYLFGKISPLPSLNFTFSGTVWMIYFIGITILTFWWFRRKDIKNI